MLEDASIKLSSVASSLRTVSARAMLTPMIDGETNPVQLANLAKGRMRRKILDLAQALTGTFEAHHAQLAKSMLRRLELVEQALTELDAVIVEACRPWQHQIELLQTIPGSRRRLRRSSWPRPARIYPGSRPRPSGRLGRAGAGHARVRRHARLTRRRGMGRAQVAVAHSMLVSAYWMLKRDEPYHDLGADWHSRRNNEAHTRRLIAQLEGLGYTVTVHPAA